jgi:hypothetical protein
MLKKRDSFPLAETICAWALGTLILQIASSTVGAEYDSGSALGVLWWVTQGMSLPIWGLSEAAGLLGVRLGGFEAYAVTTALGLAASSIFILLKRRRRTRTESPHLR